MDISMEAACYSGIPCMYSTVRTRSFSLLGPVGSAPHLLSIVLTVTKCTLWELSATHKVLRNVWMHVIVIKVKLFKVKREE